MSVTSIFNDILGPVMRGPSSSHCAASCRLGLLVRDLIKEEISSVTVEYDLHGSLARTHESQGTDMGLYGGLLGWTAEDERLPSYLSELSRRGIRVKVDYREFNDAHPNTYRIRVESDRFCHAIRAVSTGGGMIEIHQIDGTEVLICGDFHELLIFTEHLEEVKDSVISQVEVDQVCMHPGEKSCIELKSSKPFESALIEQLEKIDGVSLVRYLKPVLPILSSRSMSVPFTRCDEMLAIGASEKLSLWELALLYESQRSSLSEEQLMKMMVDLLRIMEGSIEKGLSGTHYADRILHCQSGGFKVKMDQGGLLGGRLLNTMTLYITAIMEVKSSFGLIVAAPTAGSCGALPGAVIGAGHALGASTQDIAKALFAACVPGIFISEHASFAGEVGGCQAECGSASSMAAAGLAFLAGGNLHQCMASASFALQNILGLICDPIGNRVEAPCLGRNIMAAANALASADMGLADFDPVVTFDEVVTAMHEAGTSIKHELRCTALGGLSISKTSRRLEKQLSKPRQKAQ